MSASACLAKGAEQQVSVQLIFIRSCPKQRGCHCCVRRSILCHCHSAKKKKEVSELQPAISTLST
eukprot:scaffold35468_cov228-Skeletonema_dohrnii-CCMP3373.AAC.1